MVRALRVRVVGGTRQLRRIRDVSFASARDGPSAHAPASGTSARCGRASEAAQSMEAGPSGTSLRRQR